MAANNTVTAVLTEIGFSATMAARFVGMWDDTPAGFARQWAFGLGQEKFKDMEGQEWTVGAGAAAVTHTFTSLPPQRDQFQGFVLWLHTTIAQGIQPDIANNYLHPPGADAPVIAAAAAAQQAWIQQAQEIYQLLKRKTDSQSRVEDDLVGIEKGIFKYVGQWEKTKQLIEHALRHMSSTNEVGNLRYLTREDLENRAANAPVGIYDEAYEGDFDEMTYATLAIHYPNESVTIEDTRPLYQRERQRVRKDSARLWEVIARLTEGQPTYDLVRKFQKTRDGLGAYRRLRAEAEGSTARTTKVTTAYKTIQNTTYNGRSPRFTYSAFITKQEGAFAVLAEEGEPQAESKKVNDLLTHITDPRLENAKDHIAGDAAKLNNYELASQYLGTCLANRAASASTGSGRNVGTTESERKDEKEHKVDAIEKKTPSGVKWQDGRWLSKSEYRKLHDWERKEHRKIVANLPESEKKGRPSRSRSRKRKGSPDGTSERSTKSVKTDKTGTESTAKAGTSGTKDVPKTPAAGDQFGRASHTNKKKGVEFEIPEKE